jgi:hypothetical protein
MRDRGFGGGALGPGYHRDDGTQSGAARVRQELDRVLRRHQRSTPLPLVGGQPLRCCPLRSGQTQGMERNTSRDRPPPVGAAVINTSGWAQRQRWRCAPPPSPARWMSTASQQLPASLARPHAVCALSAAIFVALRPSALVHAQHYLRETTLNHSSQDHARVWPSWKSLFVTVRVRSRRMSGATIA